MKHRNPLPVNRSAGHKRLIIALIAGLTLVLDQATKFIILRYLSVFQTIPVIPGLFNITRIHNPGGAFGFLADQTMGIRAVLFIVISLMAAGFILYLYIRTPPRYPWLLAALALIFGGAMGNLIDRVRYGAVVDFLDVYVKTLHWPAFNVADSAISVGMAVLLFHLVFKKVPV